jgi:glycosyltransferase involved in cell wall biosynthesis
MACIHLFVPMLHRRDAVGEHTSALRDRLRAQGIECRIFTERIDPETEADTRPYLAYEAEATPGDVLVYQVATASAMADWLATRPEPVVLNYHSITPPTFFAAWNNGIARLQVEALAELGLLAPRAALGIGVSTFDAAELTAAGCRNVRVIPVASVSVPPVEPDPNVLAELDADHRVRPGPRWLSVGRLAPNKGHERTLAALASARATAAANDQPGAHLTIVGGPTEPTYARALRRFADVLGVDDAVTFTTGLSEAALAAHYRASDVLVMLSEHEGFGVPLLEAMGQRLPIVALEAGAIAEVLGGVGVLLTSSAPGVVASAVADLLADADRREAAVVAGAERFASFGLESAGSDLVEALVGVRDGVGGGVPQGSASGGPMHPDPTPSH